MSLILNTTSFAGNYEGMRKMQCSKIRIESLIKYLLPIIIDSSWVEKVVSFKYIGSILMAK